LDAAGGEARRPDKIRLMENPKSVHRFLAALIALFSVLALGLSIYFREFYILIGWVALLVLFTVLCFVLALFNVVVFAPIFWLAGRLTGRTAEINTQSSDEHKI
jgi:hypothetical protein